MGTQTKRKTRQKKGMMNNVATSTINTGRNS